MDGLKRVLIVDDSEIDRTVLKSILECEYEVYEADDGRSALDIIVKRKRPIDAIFLDISMPLLDGISVLRIIRENKMEDIPIFMITSEATKDNIEKAVQYNIEDFIRKPFNKDVILDRVRERLGVDSRSRFREIEIEETRKYIADLESIYDQYVTMMGQNKRHDVCRAHFMETLIKKKSMTDNETQADSFQLEILSRAAYLCNIGNVLLFDTLGENRAENSEMYQQHTILGAKLVRLNYSEYCEEFVKICSDICLHHHERYDGIGFPDGLSGDDISEYAQICGLFEKFDKLFYLCSKRNAVQFDYVVNQIENDIGFVSDEVLSLLRDCKEEIVQYYTKYKNN